MTDGTHYTPEYVDNGVRFYSALNVKENEFFYHDEFKWISLKEHQTLFKRCNPEANDLLIRKVGVGPRYCCVIPEGLPEFSIFVSVALIKIDKRKINPWVLSTFINSYYGQMQLLRIQKGSSQPDLHLEDIMELKIPIFSNNIQYLIEEIVKKGLSSSNNSRISLEKANSILLANLGLNNWNPNSNNYFIRQLSQVQSSIRIDSEHFLPKYDNLNHIIHKNAVNVRTIQSIKSFNDKGSNPNYFDNGKIHVINSQHILESHLDYGNFDKTLESYWESDKKCRIYKNDILIYMTGANIGRTQVYLEEEKAVAGMDTGILRIINENPIYVGFVLNSLIGRYQTQKFKTGSAQAHIYPQTLNHYFIPFIEKSKQDEIAALYIQSHKLKKQSKQLLEKAKKAIEIAIELNEKTAIEYLKEN